MINGSPEGFFQCNHGVRQGDPLSPLLFCIAEDFLSRYIKRKVDEGSTTPIFAARGISISIPTHLLFADDIILFRRASKKNVRCIMEMFNTYENLSGQRINGNKSDVFFFGKYVTMRRADDLLNTLKMRRGELPFRYLGVRFV